MVAVTVADVWVFCANEEFCGKLCKARGTGSCRHCASRCSEPFLLRIVVMEQSEALNSSGEEAVPQGSADQAGTWEEPLDI